MNYERLPWIGEDPASQRLFELAQRVAPVPTTILITGESGTGKEYLARLIHEIGPKRDTPFLRVDCGSLPAAMIDSELFGHERGAVPGAAERKIGQLELARNGTVVLDQVSLLSAEAQAKLVGALREESFERFGGKEPVKLQARVIALTEVDLTTLAQQGKFREDLLQLMDMVKLWVPPLRERRGDIAPLSELFLQAVRARNGKPEVSLSEDAKLLLAAYRWPGNIRELRTALEHAAATGKAERLTPEDFPAEVRARSSQDLQESNLPSLEDLERAAIEETLRVTRHQIGRSAQILGISRKTLLEKRKKYGMQ